MQPLEGLREELLISPKLPEAYTKAEKSINGLIDTCIGDLQQLKERHNKHIVEHVSSYQKFEQLRRKLLNGEPLNADEATGDAVANMLKEMKQMASLANPYCLSGAEGEQRMAEVRQSMTDIGKNIETLWTTIVFRDRTIAICDLTAISSTTTIVDIVNCRSKEWTDIGEILATLPQITTLTVEHCDSEDSLCTGISRSKSLRNLCMSNVCVIQRTATSPTKESNSCAKWNN
jgi:hypothetical protein